MTDGRRLVQKPAPLAVRQAGLTILVVLFGRTEVVLLGRTGGGPDQPNLDTDGGGLLGDGLGATMSLGSCFEVLEDCDSDSAPEAGGVVMVYAAPVGQDGQPDDSKLQPIHIATSNGDNTYSSKNGFPSEQNDDATWEEAFGEYIDDDPSDGSVTVVKCFKKKAGC